MSVPRLQLLALRVTYAIETVQQIECCTHRRTRHGFAAYLKRELREMHAELVELQRLALDDEGAAAAFERELGLDGCDCGSTSAADDERSESTAPSDVKS